MSRGNGTTIAHQNRTKACIYIKKGIVIHELYSPLRLLPFLRFILEISTVLCREVLKNICPRIVGKTFHMQLRQLSAHA